LAAVFGVRSFVAEDAPQDDKGLRRWRGGKRREIPHFADYVRNDVGRKAAVVRMTTVLVTIRALMRNGGFGSADGFDLVGRQHIANF
jgi:hypothetical protein